MPGLNYNYPFGARVPDSMHSVVCSFPTIKDIKYYEERNPEALSAIKAAYPRFFRHQYLQNIDQKLRHLEGSPNRVFYPLTSQRAAEEMIHFLKDSEALIFENNSLCGVHIPDTPELNSQVWSFIQHTGCTISSREAEDWLYKHGVLKNLAKELSYKGDADYHTRETLRVIYDLPSIDDVLLCNSGMNAFYAAYLAINELQKAKGKKKWVQLGWLYVDTGHILNKFSDAEPIHHYDVFDIEGLKQIFSEQGNEIAGIITEAPTNPLLQTSDLDSIYSIAKKNDAILVTDPTLASPQNIDVLPYTDLAVNSLTKYAASVGDVLSGAVVFNRASAYYEELKTNLPKHHEPPYIRDLSRLALEIDSYSQYVEKVNRNTISLVHFLENSQAVRKVYWSYEKQSRNNYEKLARSSDVPGCMLTISLNIPLSDFYDRIATVKGPSFGTTFTLLCPFMHLAHYELVSKKTGRDYLWSLNLDPDLVRISVGTEDSDVIIETFSEVI